MANGEIFELIDDLGLADKIVPTRSAANKRYILRDGKPVALPGGAVEGDTTKAFSIGGRLRVLKEPFIRSSTNAKESVYGFVERRLGKEMADYAIDPFVSGIYAGDPRKLSLQNAFPKMHALEANNGSIIKGALWGKRTRPNRSQRLTEDVLVHRRNADPRRRYRRESRRRSPRNPGREFGRNNGGYTVNDDKYDSVALCTPARATHGF